MCLVGIADLRDKFGVIAMRVLKNFIKSMVKAYQPAKGFRAVSEIFRKNAADMATGIVGTRSQFADGDIAVSFFDALMDECGGGRAGWCFSGFV